jgi:hypothetical protein
MPSSKKADSAPVRETALRSGLATRRYTSVKTDADIEYMVAATGVIADCFDAVEEKFITVTKIQKRAIMDKEFNPPLGPNGAGSVAIIPYQAGATAMPLNRSAKREAFHHFCYSVRGRSVLLLQLFRIPYLPVIGQQRRKHPKRRA